MPFNSGVYTLPVGNPVVTNTVISSTVQNNTMSDVATALSTALLKDGSQTVTNDIPFAGFKLTGIGAATARTDAASLATIQDGTGIYIGTVGGTVDVITLTASPPITAYAAGQRFSFIAGGANTTVTTVNINALGAKSVTKFGATALAAGDIVSAAVTTIEYDGTQFQLLGARVSTTGSALTVTARASNTILAGGDLGQMFQFTSTFTQTFTAAATLGSGWYIDLQNIGTGVITLDANSSETFNTPGGARTTINVYPGEGFRVVCNGTGFDLVGRSSRPVLQATQSISSAVCDFTQGFDDTEFMRICVVFTAVLLNGVALSMLVRKSGAFVTGSTYSTGLTFANATSAVSATAQSAAFIGGVNGSSSQENSGYVTINQPTSALGNQAIMSQCATPEAGTPPQANACTGGSFETTAAAITGVRFCTPSNGAMISGVFTAYGERG